MSLQLKKKFKENLDLIPVYIEDTSLTSEAYFGIKEFPSFFGRGKNGVRVKPNRVTLKPNSQLYIEILDVNRKSVYYEIPDYEPGDLSRYISVWVYGERDDMYNTPNGIGEMIICGIAERTDDGEIIPEEFRDVINVRWRRKISISRDTRSESKIVFSQIQTLQPTLLVSQSVTFFRNIPTGSISGSTAKTNEILNIPIVYTSDTSGQNVFLELQSSSAFFKPEYLNSGVIKFNLQNVTLSPPITPAETNIGILKPTTYSASLQPPLINRRKVRVSNPLTSSITGSKFQSSYLKTFTGFSTGSFSIEYLSTGSVGTTPLSIVDIKINNINPIIGNVDKINVYARSRSILSENTQYRLIGVKILNEPISSSITDIYYNTTGNLTSSIFTFPFTPLKENDPTDIKVEFVNILNDTSEFILEKELYIPGPSAPSTPTTLEPTPEPPTIQITPIGTPTITIQNPAWNPDRFDNEEQSYIVTGNFQNSVLNSYIYVVTASLFTGSVLLATTSISSARSVSTSTLTTSGSQIYTLQLTASISSSNFSNEYLDMKDVSETFTLNKNNPEPIYLMGRDSYLSVQKNLVSPLTSLGSPTTIVEQRASGSLVFGYDEGNSSGWELIPNSLTASIVTGPTTIQYKGISAGGTINHPWTGSMTGSNDVFLSATAKYRSPTGKNIPPKTYEVQSAGNTFTKIKSIRWGIVPNTPIQGWPGTSPQFSQLQTMVNNNQDNFFSIDYWNYPTGISPSNNNRRINFNVVSGNQISLDFHGPNSGYALLIIDSNFSISGNVISGFNNAPVDSWNAIAGTNTANIFYAPISGPGFGYKVYAARLRQTMISSWQTNPVKFIFNISSN